MDSVERRFGIGQPVRRTEDPRLLRGDGRFTDDVAALTGGALHAVFVRSPHAHALIRGIDVRAALALPGVVAVVTGEELRAAGRGHLPCEVPITQADGTPARYPRRLALPHDVVSHVGEAVAMVVAETEAAARDGAEAVAVDWEPLPPVIGLSQARTAPAIHPDVPGNRVFLWQAGDAAATERAFASAANVVETRLRVTRVAPAPLETRAAIAEYDRGTGRWTLTTATQGTAEAHGELTGFALATPRQALRIVTPDVGGGFGMKNHAYPEHVALLHAAERLGRPVRWSAERTEAFLSDSAGRDHEIEIALAFDPGHRITAVRWHWVSDLGAWCAGAGPFVATLGAPRIAAGPYAIGTYHLVSEGYLTTTAPIDAYRGAGKPEAAFVLEVALDRAARRLGLDPVALRRINLVPPEAMPYRSVTGQVFDSGDFPRLLAAAEALAERAGFAARREAARKRGRLRGLGLAYYIEPSGFRDNRVMLAFDRTGGVTLTTSAVSNGQPHATVLAQILHERLRIPFDRIRVVQGDSDVTGYASGTAGSRSLTLSGIGIHRCAEAIEAKGRRIAARLLEVSDADIVADRGVFRVTGTDRAVTLEAVAKAAWSPAFVPEDESLGLEASAHPVQRVPNYPNGCHVAEVEIDPETGRVELVAYTAVNDFGVVVNPLTLAGQVMGGIAQGAGQVLLEELVHDPDTGQVLTASLMDYALPRADDLPPLRTATIEIPCTTNPLGVKGCGEAGCAGSLPAVLNAIEDALASAGAGPIDMPATPERVWRALREAPNTRA
ncbi:xanthine dehydrogenase family protein molybdopterin-binding subunit [Elioraea tepida]|uniref:Xanthine dehydrogenase family protein molybdopterin-binding subunit n=1 Tax=Elioraea tepida TaxID=2843330 RepID=A0A975YJP7_9PROT|nr:xanthine dehydrogenase family protein molybdopterin-binding subunit [Elioraea tepida]QXM24894.1 xanthine dehydrogenase family protein molybdopterin-binding subunit [Elioraea tepida]